MIKFFTGIQRNWIIESNAPVLEDIKNINDMKSARNIRTYAISTLYTKIPLEDLKERLKRVTEKAFHGGENQYIYNLLIIEPDGWTAAERIQSWKKKSTNW